eukprot:gnl/TRDRNA2_/TRDRNA2_85122_c1_seq1.p1 gnl/TRDRNA2_/TRDRNA2_85122_c1~~gnl/TRDRNA2_/TRDRNA2_85122_c1_seq1.p1  ORF type:complete len:469 (+),score=71.67 gnl/TRDRNA2_/TRDRNA2_85122_c1_seq1:37-1407(+)
MSVDDETVFLQEFVTISTRRSSRVDRNSAAQWSGQRGQVSDVNALVSTPRPNLHDGKNLSTEQERGDSFALRKNEAMTYGVSHGAGITSSFRWWHIIGGCLLLLTFSLIVSSRLRTYMSTACAMALRSMHVIVITIIYMMASVGLLCFNKYLMTPKLFPYPVPLVMLHSGFSAIVSLLALKAAPSIFPAITGPVGGISLDCDFIVRRLGPVSIFFAASLVCSNTAYFYCSLAFLQMVKESTVVITYFLALAVALERFSSVRFGLVVLIVLATGLTAHGAIHFSVIGFCLQIGGVVSDAAKSVLQSLMLQTTDRKLDPMTYVLLVSPLSFLVLGVPICAEHLLGSKLIAIPQLSEMAGVWHLLLANACVAYLLNLLIAYFLKICSPVTVAVIGIAKDMFVVFGGIVLFSEDITTQQACGFVLQLVLIFAYSLIKLSPDLLQGLNMRYLGYGTTGAVK